MNAVYICALTAMCVCNSTALAFFYYSSIMSPEMGIFSCIKKNSPYLLLSLVCKPLVALAQNVFTLSHLNLSQLLFHLKQHSY